MRKAMIAPILFGLLTIIIIAGYISVVLILPVPLIFKILAGVVVVAITSAMIYVLIQRNKEIKEENSIDLSKY